MFTEHFSKSKRPHIGRFAAAKMLSNLSPRPVLPRTRSPFNSDKDSSPHAHLRGRINTTYFAESIEMEAQAVINEEEDEEPVKKNPHDLALLEAK